MNLTYMKSLMAYLHQVFCPKDERGDNHNISNVIWICIGVAAALIIGGAVYGFVQTNSTGWSVPAPTG
ncbi:MAG: hypothetical protein LBR20_06590 [Propionibacteriaceae bacterium]|jgi:hypothetical protein|nr:hypothetical protein [Propionibacteriaceae bacterium]